VWYEQAPTYKTAQAAREELNSFFDNMDGSKHAHKKDFTAAAAKQQLNAIFGNSKADHMDKKIHTIEQKTVSFVRAGPAALLSAHGSARKSALGFRFRFREKQLIFARAGTAARLSAHWAARMSGESSLDGHAQSCLLTALAARAHSFHR
jgi:hypothetical protein